MAKGVQFTESAARRIAAAVRQVEGARKDLRPYRGRRRSVGSGGGSTFIPVRLSAFDATNKIYTGVKQEADGLGGYSDISPAENLKCFEVKDFIGIELGAIVHVQQIGTWEGSESIMASGTAIYGFNFVQPRQMFGVLVTKTGGSQGTNAAAATWTYTAKSPDGHTLGTNLTPERRRPSIGNVSFPANDTAGTGYYDDGGTFHLYDANEVIGPGAC